MNWTDRHNAHYYELFPGTSLVVHRHRDWKPDSWLFSGRGFLSGFDTVLLRSKDLDAAKREALERVRESLRRMVDMLK